MTDVAAAAHHQGTVAAFDAHRGLGVVRAADGAEYPFHCTAILDGSREIDPGVTVRFDLGPGPHGRWEAQAVARVD